MFNLYGGGRYFPRYLWGSVVGHEQKEKLCGGTLSSFVSYEMSSTVVGYQGVSHLLSLSLSASPTSSLPHILTLLPWLQAPQ